MGRKGSKVTVEPTGAKVPCRHCGHEILPTTATKTGGRCMPCFKLKWYGRLARRITDRFGPKPPSESELALQKQASDEFRRWLSNVDATTYLPLPPVKPVEVPTWTRTTVRLSECSHLGLLLAAERIVRDKGGESQRQNGGFTVFLRQLRLGGALAEISVTPEGTFLATCGLFPAWLSSSRRASEGLVRQLVAELASADRTIHPISKEEALRIAVAYEAKTSGVPESSIEVLDVVLQSGEGRHRVDPPKWMVPMKIRSKSVDGKNVELRGCVFVDYVTGEARPLQIL